MATTVNVRQAKTHFSKLLERVRLGEEIIVVKAGKPVARLIPVTLGATRREPGSAKGRFVIEYDFDSPLPDRLLDNYGVERVW